MRCGWFACQWSQGLMNKHILQLWDRKAGTSSKGTWADDATLKNSLLKLFFKPHGVESPPCEGRQVHVTKGNSRYDSRTKP